VTGGKARSVYFIDDGFEDFARLMEQLFGSD